MLILCYLLTYIFVTYSKIIIKDAGVAALSREDIGMIFYLTVFNNDTGSYHVHVKMQKCCEIISGNDRDCEVMNLLGGDMGILQGKSAKNITLLYPNMFLHNRKGKCMISVYYANTSSQFIQTQQTIRFNTTISKTHILPLLRGYYNKAEVKICNSVDLDPLEHCEPVNCPMKYLGSRNYFNYKWKRCQRVPYCVSDLNKDLPDVAYIPTSNKCRDLEKVMNKNDLRKLEKGIVNENYNKNIPNLSANLRCHHGILDNETGFCICDEGWTSASFDGDQYEPSLSIYHMCNIEMNTWSAFNQTKIKVTILIVAIMGVCIAMIILIISFVLQLIYKCLKSFEVNHLECDNSCSLMDSNIHNGSKLEGMEQNNHSPSTMEIASKQNKPFRNVRSKICNFITCSYSKFKFKYFKSSKQENGLPIEHIPLKTYKKDKRKEEALSNQSIANSEGSKGSEPKELNDSARSISEELLLISMQNSFEDLNSGHQQHNRDVHENHSLIEYLETEQFQPRRSLEY